MRFLRGLPPLVCFRIAVGRGDRRSEEGASRKNAVRQTILTVEGLKERLARVFEAGHVYAV